jgi:O-methyltransferase
MTDWNFSHRAYVCLQAFYLHGPLKMGGDVIEMGVYRGSTTVRLAEAVSRCSLDKKVYACDTFRGLSHTEGNLKKGSMRCDVDQFVENLKSYPQGDYSDVVVPVVGRIERTLKTLEDKRFCFAWLDMDLETPTRFGIKWLEKRMLVGGIIGFHDYDFHLCPGIKKAVQEEVNWDAYKHLNIPAINCYFIKKVR